MPDRSLPQLRSLFVLTIALITLTALLGGCTKLAPRSTALRNIHHTYRTEFEQYLQLTLPAPSADGPIRAQPRTPAESAGPLPFATTLREIRGYRIRYGEGSREAAHLIVLEGMIYLQTGQLGMARLLLPDLRKAADKLGNGDGARARDQMLAQNFEALLAGWSAIREAEKQKTLDLARLLAEAAQTISGRLTLLGRQALTPRVEPEVDEGAIYLATSGAIFYAWVGEILSLQAREDRPCWCEKGRALIEPLLSEAEKRIARAIDYQSIPAGRIRYLGWYNSLAVCAGQKPDNRCHARLRQPESTQTKQ